MRNYLFGYQQNKRRFFSTFLALLLLLLSYPTISQTYYYLGPIQNSGNATVSATVNHNVGFTTNPSATPTAAIKTTEFFSS
jgi:hypothetical protein